MRHALHAEWTKMRTVAGTGWLALTTIVLTIGMSAAVCAAVESSVTEMKDTTKISLLGIDLAQVVVAIVAVLAVCGEYSTGLIRITLAATPRRSTLLAAKAIVVGAITLVVGTISVLGSVAVGRLVLPGRGFTEARGYSPLSLTDGPTLRAAVGSVLYLALIALLGLGIAMMVRDAAVAIAVVLGLLFLFPVVVSFVTDPAWQRHLKQIGPMSAGLAIQSTTDLADLPIGPWAGLGVLAAWAVAALVIGGAVLHARDA